MTIRTNAFAALAALTVAAHALPASAAIIVGSTPIASPVASTGFETMPPAIGPGVDYIDGGVVVRGVGDEGGQNGVLFELSDPHGVGSWGTIDQTGYTLAKLESGGTFNSFSGFFGSQGFGAAAQFVAQFRLGGVSVGEVNAGALALEGQTISFTGFTADEVWFAGTQGGTLGAGGKNRIGIDDLAFGVTTGGVPEPATWGLMIAGFGLAGAALRRRQTATDRFAR